MQVGEMSSEGCCQLEVVAGEKTTGNRGGRARFLEAGAVEGISWLGLEDAGVLTVSWEWTLQLQGVGWCREA